MTSQELDGLHLARRFRFERVLNEDPQTKTLAVLGQIRASDAGAKPAVLILERQAFPPHLFASSPATVDDNDDGGIRIPFADQLRLRETNDIYNWFEAWTATDTLQSTGDSKMTIVVNLGRKRPRVRNCRNGRATVASINTRTRSCELSQFEQ
ncbi:hypothetical protein GQ42DRAFT_162894 [Ramicandelaber brevisporus]|nr:hypothetical protein GQ42DRAFT_162894 [Ramicandelaber brevisporus]